LTTFSHPAFAPYQALIGRLPPAPDIPALNTLAAQTGLCHADGRPLRFTSKALPRSATAYEQQIFHEGRIPTREDNLHDFLNALVWLRFPALKSALNRRHCQMLAQDEERRQRGKVRDALTLLDESGVLVASPRQDLLDRLANKDWVALFWDARAEIDTHLRFIVVGHGLLEKCLRPFAAMTGKCLLLETAAREPAALDRLAAGQVSQASSLSLPPLPIQGIPGWDVNDARVYYENAQIFRPPRA
jgi:hypothetical protein